MASVSTSSKMPETRSSSRRSKSATSASTTTAATGCKVAEKKKNVATVKKVETSSSLYERSSNDSFESIKSTTDEEDNMSSRAQCLKFASQLDELNLFVSIFT